MSKDPAFLFYPGDWLGGTMGMSFEEKGAYMELLMMQFNRGHMTEHMVGQAIGQLWDKVQVKFIQDKDGLYYNERLDFEKEKRKTFTESRRNNIEGKNQYSKQDEKEGHLEGHMTTHMEDGNVNVNVNDIIKENEHQNYVDLWFYFYEARTKTKPTFNKGEGNAIKQIKSKSDKLANGKGYRGIDLFYQMLNKFEYLDSWQKENCLDVKMFNSKFDIIFNKLKSEYDGQDELLAEIIAKHSR